MSVDETPADARSDDVLVETRDGIRTVTINRPERRNALSVAVSNRLAAIWRETDEDPSVRVAVLTSADCGTFCAGMDLKEAAEIGRRGIDVLSLCHDPYQSAMRACRTPIIAAMTGHFSAGGMMLALNADLRVGLAGTSGGITEVRVGRGSPWGVPLVWMLPQAILAELVLCGAPLPIETLHRHGFINAVEPTPDAVRARAQAMAETIRDNAPLSVRAGKRMIQAGMDLGCAGALDAANDIYRGVYASADAQEGPRAFAERRRPAWTGR